MKFLNILDKLTATGFPLPKYLTYGQKTAGNPAVLPSYDGNEFELTSKENVYLCAIKAACMEDRFKHDLFIHRAKLAADRYGNRADVDRVLEKIAAMEDEPAHIRTEEDWQKAYDFLFKNAELLDNDIVQGLADLLLKKTAEVRHIPMMEETYSLRKLAGLPLDTPELQAYADKFFHKLANGSFYYSHQFSRLPVDEVRIHLPDLLKSASFEMNVINPNLFGRAAEKLEPLEADILSILMEKVGELPVREERDLPVEINDEVLAQL
jgi:hypothetical protein